MSIQWRLLVMGVVLAFLYLADDIPNVVVRRVVQVFALLFVFWFAWYSS